MQSFWKSIQKAWCIISFGIPEVDAYARSIMEKEIRNGLGTMCLVLFVLLSCGAWLNFILDFGPPYLLTYLLLAALCLNILLASQNTSEIQALNLLGVTLLVVSSTALVLLAHKTGTLSVPLLTAVVFIFIVIPLVPWGMREALSITGLVYFVFTLSTLSVQGRFDRNTLLLLQFFMANAAVIALIVVYKNTSIRKKEIKSIYELELARKELQKLSNSDPLTGAWNRRYLNDRYAKELKMHRENNRVFYFILTDIDDFKKLNDSYGHEFGDQVLQLVVDSFTKYLGPGDNLIRMGGDEFVLIVGSQEPRGLIEKGINRINKQINQKRKDVTEIVAMSFGMVLVSPDAEVSLKEVYQKADKGLYASKNEQGTSIHEDSILSPDHMPVSGLEIK